MMHSSKYRDRRPAPAELPPDVPRPAALLKGTARGLEIHVDAPAGLDAIVGAVTARLEEAPGFFKGSDVRIKVEGGALPTGCLARLDDLAARFELRIVEVGAASKKGRGAEDAVPTPSLATGSAPAAPAALADAPSAPAPVATAPLADGSAPLPVVAAAAPAVAEAPAAPAAVAAAVTLPEVVVEVAAPVAAPALPAFDLVAPTTSPVLPPTAPAAAIAAAVAEALAPGARLVVGPVRSGVILEHHGHLIVFGDVNPGAEVRAEGNIVILGRLRGTAHAGIGRDVGFILALRLEPQQLRIARKVARAGDSDQASTDAEIAYCTGDQIVVERYLGKLPKDLASSL